MRALLLASCGAATATVPIGAFRIAGSVLESLTAHVHALNHMQVPHVKTSPPAPKVPHCAENMVLVRGKFCIDAYEASTVDVDEQGRTLGPHSPFAIDSHDRVRAESQPGVFPQGYISQVQASAACKLAGKRLCTDKEWLAACRGETEQTYPYGTDHERGRCNEDKISPFNKLYNGITPISVFSSNSAMNDPRINQVGGLEKTGSNAGCRTPTGIYDMVGNLHEWTADREGTFRGGYYRDTRQHGPGCTYLTTGHNIYYHDYSTGFRCCGEPTTD